MNIFGKHRNTEVSSEQISLVTSILTQKYDVYEKGMYQKLLNDNIELKLEIADLSERVKNLEYEKEN